MYAFPNAKASIYRDPTREERVAAPATTEYLVKSDVWISMSEASPSQSSLEVGSEISLRSFAIALPHGTAIDSGYRLRLTGEPVDILVSTVTKPVFPSKADVLVTATAPVRR